MPPETKARLTDLLPDGTRNPHADGTGNLGNQLLSTYLVPFEVLSLLLLAVLIGASYLARPRVPTTYIPPGGAPAPARQAVPPGATAAPSAAVETQPEDRTAVRNPAVAPKKQGGEP